MIHILFSYLIILFIFLSLSSKKNVFISVGFDYILPVHSQFWGNTFALFMNVKCKIKINWSQNFPFNQSNDTLFVQTGLARWLLKSDVDDLNVKNIQKASCIFQLAGQNTLKKHNMTPHHFNISLVAVIECYLLFCVRIQLVFGTAR